MPTTTFTATSSEGERTVAEIVGRLAGRGFEIADVQSVTRTVLDSFDGRLHDAGLRLELLRHDGPHSVQQLVLSAAGSISATISVKRTPRFASDLPIGPFRPRLAPALEMRALLPVVSFTDVVTTAVDRDAADKTVAAVAIHEPIVRARSVVPLVIEVTELVGHPKPAGRASAVLAKLGFERCADDLVGLVLQADGVDPAGFDSSPTVGLDGGMSAISGFRAVFENLAGTITANLPGTIDDIDTEFLHELRVAIRRTRSVLGHGKGVVAGKVRQRYRDEFAWLAALTGRTRDLDVYILEWDRYVSHLSNDRVAHLQPVLLHLQQDRARAFREMVKGLQSDRAQALLAAWQAMLRHPELGPETAPKAHRPLHRVVAKRIRDSHQTLVDDGRAINDSSPAEALHELRKDAKKLRYAVECFGGLLAKSDRKLFVRQLKGLQDNLGEHQDADVHRGELLDIAHRLAVEKTAPDTLLALGALTEHLQFGQIAARSEFARRFAAYDSEQTRAILARLLESIDGR